MHRPISGPDFRVSIGGRPIGCFNPLVHILTGPFSDPEYNLAVPVETNGENRRKDIYIIANMKTKMSSEDDNKAISPVSGGMRQILDHNSKLRAQLREAESERARQMAEMEERVEEIKAAHEAELVRVKESMHELNTVQKQLDETRGEVERLEGERAALQSELEAAQAVVAEKTEQLNQEQEASSKLQRKLDHTKNTLNKAREDIEDLQANLDKMKPTRIENAKLKGRINVLEKDLAAEVEAKKEKIAEIEALRAEGTLQRCQQLEAENAAMKKVVEIRERETAEAKKAKDEAEAIAFESRSKLLSLYADEEAKDILKDSLDKANETLKRQSEEIARLQQELKDAAQRYNEMEHKLLYSSKRDNLRDSLSALAKRRNLDDSLGDSRGSG